MSIKLGDKVTLKRLHAGELAMEARLRDAQNREIIGMFRDQRSGNLQGIIDRWGLQLIELINTPLDYQVGDG